MTRISLYTDGACSGNPGPGGWGVLMVVDSTQTELKGGATQTTNNRMELTAAIEGLKALPSSLSPRASVDLYTDSKYVRDGITQWIVGWRRNGWRTAAKKPVKNLDLWQELDELSQSHAITWHWVKGHAGHDGNERADQLANEGMAKVR